MQSARKEIRPDNKQNGKKAPTFTSSTRLGEEVEASHPTSYHPRALEAKGEARRGKNNTKNEGEVRKKRGGEARVKK